MGLLRTHCGHVDLHQIPLPDTFCRVKDTLLIILPVCFSSAYWTPTLNFIYSNGTTVIVEQVGGMLA